MIEKVNKDQTITGVLMNRLGIQGVAGTKVECPFCGHETFSIKRDDTLGKCFHPSCGRYITVLESKEGVDHTVNRFLESVYYDFHRALISQKVSPAYKYLNEERRIHPQVIADSMLGMVPENYDLDKGFDSHTDEINIEIKEKLIKCVYGSRGWLCFFYTDDKHRIVSIRFRKPYSKQIMYFKPFNRAGLFGHSLFSPEPFSDSTYMLNNLIVTEGEFNQLQLQSLCARHSESTGKSISYLPACAIGGVLGADYETIRQITRHPVICYDNDASGAGFVLVKKAQELMNAEAFTTPDADSDLDNFIRGFGDNHTKAWEAVKGLVVSRQLFPRKYEGLASQVFAVRQKQGRGDSRREFEINIEVARIIRNDLKDRGRFYNDGQTGYFFFNAEKRLIKIHQDDDECTLMLARYGINPSEAIFRYQTKALWLEALENGTKTDIHRLSYYNPNSYSVYLFRHNNQIYFISPNIIKLVDNGTDGVLFLANPRARPFEIGQVEESTSWFDRTIVSRINFADDLLTPDERRLIFTIWFYSLFFESIMPTKPILAFIGQKGSGKSITMRKVGMLLIGENFNVTPLTDDSKDFDAAVTNFPFVAIDNADSRCSWLNDRLATVATGGTIKKRKLYTDNKLVEIPARCFLAITSRTPHFRRDDVADRLLIMRVERFKDFKSEKMLLNEVIRNRDKIMTEVVYGLQEVVRALRDGGNGSNGSGSFRMADFADFAIKVTRYAGVEREVRIIFKKLSREQSTFTLENDPIFDLLEVWVNKSDNRGREVTNTELCGELTHIAEEEKTAFLYRDNPRGFAQRMANLRSDLAEFYDITERIGRGRKKYFTFRKKLELEVK